MLSHNNQPERYFVGISLPSGLDAEITAAQRLALRKHSNHMRRPIIPHITLLHPGQASVLPKGRLIAGVKEAVSGLAAFSAELTDIGVYNERVLYAGVGNGCLRLLYNQLTDSLLPGDSPMTDDFAPHVTLAQSNKGVTLSHPLIGQLTEAITPTLHRPFVIGEIDLFNRVAPRIYTAESIAVLG